MRKELGGSVPMKISQNYRPN